MLTCAVSSILPSWTFGLWLSTSFLTSYSSETVSGFLQGMQERQCPVRVFHLDCFWMKQYEWYAFSLIPLMLGVILRILRCSFTFDPDNFPDPKAYLSEIKQKYGVKICLWSMFMNTMSMSPTDSHFHSQSVHLSTLSNLSRRRSRRIFHQTKGWDALAVSIMVHSTDIVDKDYLVQMGSVATR